MARVSDEEVLLLWRALSSYRSGPQPRCAPCTRLLDLLGPETGRIGR